jgi:hypothetical protein
LTVSNISVRPNRSIERRRMRHGSHGERVMFAHLANCVERD